MMVITLAMQIYIAHVEALRNDGRNDILYYGIAFCRKRCKVVSEKA